MCDRRACSLPGPAKVALLSAHPDDVAFSIGGFLRLFPNLKTTLVSVFTKSRHAPRSDHHGNEAMVTELRHEEDEAYAAAIGAELVRLGFPDATLRWTSPPTHYDHLQNEQRLANDVRDAVYEAVLGVVPDIVFAPLAFGDHCDHLLTRRASGSCASIAPMVFYEDMPYGYWNGGSAKLSEFAQETVANAAPVHVDIGDVATEKAEDLRFYASQTDGPWIADAMSYASSVSNGRGCVERLWMTPGAVGWITGIDDSHSKSDNG